MNFRTFTILGVTGLCALTAAAGYTADRLDLAAQQMAADDSLQQACMETGIDTPEGRVGCFTPVIAIIDESFFTSDDVTVADDDAAAE